MKIVLTITALWLAFAAGHFVQSLGASAEPALCRPPLVTQNNSCNGCREQ